MFWLWINMVVVNKLAPYTVDIHIIVVVCKRYIIAQNGSFSSQINCDILCLIYDVMYISVWFLLSCFLYASLLYFFDADTEINISLVYTKNVNNRMAPFRYLRFLCCYYIKLYRALLRFSYYIFLTMFSFSWNKDKRIVPFYSGSKRKRA